jgi:Flp pilus assembly protein TadB
MSLVGAAIFLAAISQSVSAQVPPGETAPPNQATTTSLANEQASVNKKNRGDVTTDTPEWSTQMEELEHGLKRLPMAAALACVLAMRPRRRGTPPRQPAVIQTQIILAVVGAVVMLVVGSSLARAFGIVGAAGLVRYRAKIADP